MKLSDMADMEPSGIYAKGQGRWYLLSISPAPPDAWAVFDNATDENGKQYNYRVPVACMGAWIEVDPETGTRRAAGFMVSIEFGEVVPASYSDGFVGVRIGEWYCDANWGGMHPRGPGDVETPVSVGADDSK